MDVTTGLDFRIFQQAVATRFATMKLTPLKELEEAKAARLRAEKKHQILEIIARKENKDLEEKSLDELKGLLANL